MSSNVISYLITMNKGLKIVFWNVRSLANKIDTIRCEVGKLEPDILNINETWLHDNIIDDFVKIDGYILLRSDRKTLVDDGQIKKGGGLCTYVRKNIVCSDIVDMSISNRNIELSVVKYDMQFTRPIYIFNIYRPPLGDIDAFISDLSQSVGHFRNIKCDIFIGGDFNIDIVHSNSQQVKKLNKFLKLNQLSQLVNSVTRPDSNAILDLILTNCEIIKECAVLDINISDHLPIYVIRKKTKIVNEKIEFKGRSYKHLDKDTIGNRLDEIDWTTFPQLDVDTCWDYMFDNIMRILNELCPEKTFKFAKDKPSWLSDDLVNLMKERDRRLKVYLKSKLEADKIEMRRIRNMVNIAVRSARADFIKDQLETHKNDPKKFWKELKAIIPSAKSTSSQVFNSIKNENGDIISQETLPNCINSFFANIGLELDKKIPPLSVIGNQINKKYNIDPFDNFNIISEEELMQEIKHISIYKSSGLNISTYFLKICFEILITKLLIIINKSLFTGYFPYKWRTATIVPIPKVKIPEEIGDLRPIALTPIIGKILERFVHSQLLQHLNRNNILTDFQNGFRKNHSTIDTIFKYTTDLQLNKNKNLHTISLYIDFKKAFDTVNHKILVEKLKDMKIGNKVLSWINSYLSNRNQCTRVGGNVSDKQLVCTGVPQGSILGPLFFLCYINDITCVCQDSHILLYADDTVLYKAISDTERFLDMHKFQQDVHRLVVWCQRNRLSINVKKTKLVFHPASQNSVNNINSVIKMQNTVIDYVTSYVYLGVEIDDMLTFKKHFSNIFKNVSHKLFILRKIRNMINVKAALDVTKTMFCSIIDYGNIFLSSTNDSDLHELQILQNNAIRCCFGINDPRDEHVIDIHKRANIKLIDVRRKKQILTCMWRNIHKGIINVARPIRQNRSAMATSIYLPVPRTTLFKKSVYYLGATLWNALPIDARLCGDIDSFKTEINNIFI